MKRSKTKTTHFILDYLDGEREVTRLEIGAGHLGYLCVRLYYNVLYCIVLATPESWIARGIVEEKCGIRTGQEGKNVEVFPSNNAAQRSAPRPCSLELE